MWHRNKNSRQSQVVLDRRNWNLFRAFQQYDIYTYSLIRYTLKCSNIWNVKILIDARHYWVATGSTRQPRVTAEEFDFLFTSLRVLHSHWLSGVVDSFQILSMIDIWEALGTHPQVSDSTRAALRPRASCLHHTCGCSAHLRAPSRRRFASDLWLLSVSSLNRSGAWKSGPKSCSVNQARASFL